MNATKPTDPTDHSNPAVVVPTQGAAAEPQSVPAQTESTQAQSPIPAVSSVPSASSEQGAAIPKAAPSADPDAPLPERKYDSNRDYGKSDLVTLMRRQNSSPLMQRSALIEGAELMNLHETYSRDSADGHAMRQVVESYREQGTMYDTEWALQTGFKNAYILALTKVLDERYAIHPDLPREFRWRLFGGDRKLGTFDLHIPSTLFLNNIRPKPKNDEFKREDQRMAELEGFLEAEKELGENPLLLKELYDRCKDPYLIWGIKLK